MLQRVSFFPVIHPNIMYNLGFTGRDKYLTQENRISLKAMKKN